MKRGAPAADLDFELTFLLLLSGSGADHSTTKWSASACERHLGMRKPAAHRSIRNMQERGLLVRAPGSTRAKPHYKLKVGRQDDEPIFLPNPLMQETVAGRPVMRLLREARHRLAVETLIELYGAIVLDPAHAPAPHVLRLEPGSRCIRAQEVGDWVAWRTNLEGEGALLCGALRYCRRREGVDPEEVDDAVVLLERLGAISWEFWLFSSAAVGAEPLYPLTSEGGRAAPFDGATKAHRRRRLIGAGLPDVVYLPPHFAEPAVRAVARLHPAAETPAWAEAQVEQARRRAEMLAWPNCRPLPERLRA